LWVDTGGCHDLINLSILRLETLVNRFDLLLEDQVTETHFLVDFVNDLVELLEQTLALLFQVLELLQLDFVFPLFAAVFTFMSRDLLLASSQLCLDLHVLLLDLVKLLHLFRRFQEGALDLLVLLKLTQFLFGHTDVLCASFVQLDLKRVDQVHVDASDLVVVFSDCLVLGLVLLHKLGDRQIFLRLDFGDGVFALDLHVLAEKLHFVFVLHLNFVGDALKLLA